MSSSSSLLSSSPLPASLRLLLLRSLSCSSPAAVDVQDESLRPPPPLPPAPAPASSCLRCRVVGVRSWEGEASEVSASAARSGAVEENFEFRRAQGD
eukprot:CAMPEP_0183311166 /NCGR_PEP_ID=MMETSP0160_2-20130417/35510_1 /TAXON_ID=2839 ORGANISM="Odontella Sinensis, Strain Grunow 1884" /NCGR_SAMPLE_ID=MMETSP0160_2 /ASSEMBLY_ACC=CAM_ASM_000250 /LENGTH=96 /DNA_ID=CAMNT_0025475659 /DNA_START=192 /DNA_END=483 /DNA_ORIENTATION=+